MIAQLMPVMTSDKPRKARQHASELRWGEWSPADLRKAAEELDAAAVRLRGLADALAQSGIKRLRIDGDKKHDAAMKTLDAFAANVHVALIRHGRR